MALNRLDNGCPQPAALTSMHLSWGNVSCSTGTAAKLQSLECRRLGDRTWLALEAGDQRWDFCALVQ